MQPATSITKDFDYFSQALAAVLPVGEKRLLQPVGVSFQQCGDNLFVLAD